MERPRGIPIGRAAGGSLRGGKLSRHERELAELRNGRSEIRRLLDREEGKEPDETPDQEICRGRLVDFMAMAWPSLEPGQPLKTGWALDAICDHLQAVSIGHIRRLIITVPPGMSKSVSTCVYWPAWEWGPYGQSHLKHLTFSYNIDLSKRDNRRCRQLIQSEWYQDQWGSRFALANDQNEKANFENTGKGWRKAAGIGGAATGYRADRVIIDDPLNVKEGNSAAALLEAIRFTDETLPTRLINPISSAIVWIMQRVHTNDPVGHLLEKDMGYVHLNLPMEFEHDRRCVTVTLPHLAKHPDPNVSRWAEQPWEDEREAEGDLLFEARFPQSVVDEMKKAMGSYAWAGQAQQRPAPRGGGMFQIEQIEIVDALPAGSRMVRSWDLAATSVDPVKAANPDWTRGVLCALHDGLFYLCNLQSIRKGPGSVEKLIRQTAELDGYGVAIRLPQDPGSAGKAVADRYQRIVLLGWKTYVEKETGDKATRADPFAAAVEAGNVRMIRGDWNEDVLGELRDFPFGGHDDIVDSAAAGFVFLTQRKVAAPVASIPVMDRLPAFNREF